MNFIETLINGLSMGSTYAMIALGYTMVYGIAKMLNFAHGDVIMVGAYVIFTIISTIIKSLLRWRKNNNSPRLTVDTSIVSKRMDISHHHRGGRNNSMNHSTSHTYYYVTFQVASGDRMELPVDGNEYGIMVEGDTGLLTFQGTRFLEFKRTN